MYLHTVHIELSHLHETILRVDIVATNVAWESVKAFLVFSRCHFNLRTLITGASQRLEPVIKCCLFLSFFQCLVSRAPLSAVTKSLS